MSSRTLSLMSMAGVMVFALSCRTGQQDKVYSARGGNLEVEYFQNTNTVPLFDVFEITFRHDRAYENPFFDVTIDVTLTSPAKKKVAIGGFHYGSSLPSTTLVETSQTARGEGRNESDGERRATEDILSF